MFKLSLLLSFLALINVSKGEIIAWALNESGIPYDPISMFAGDTITFQYPGERIDVYLHPSGTCNDVSSELVGLGGAENATYTFNDNQIDTNVTFAAQFWNYCELYGMIINVLVLEPPPSSFPTSAPSKTAVPTVKAPTVAPVAPVAAPTAPTDGTPADSPRGIQTESGAASMGAAVSVLLSAFVMLL